MTGPGEVLRELPAGTSAQVSAEAFGTPQYGGPPPRSAGARVGAHRLRCASLLKPLFVWAAAHAADAYRGEPARWAVDGESAVTLSDNAATNRIWLGGPPRRILDWLADATGVRWRPPGSDPRWFGGVEVTSAEVVTAYGTLAAAAPGDPAAATVLGWMRAVPTDQAMGAPTAMAEAAGVDSARVAVKAGWFGHTDEAWLRTHVVAIAEREAGGHAETLVVAAMSALPYPDADTRTRYRGDLAAGTPLNAQHDRLAGPLLRALVGTAAQELVRLA